LIFLLSACKKPLETGESLNEKLSFSSSEYTTVFKNKFTAVDSPFIKQDTLVQYYDTLKHFYSSNNFNPIYVKSFDDKGTVDSLLIIFGRAEEHGLNPEQYHLSNIKREFYQAIDTLQNTSRYLHLANAELLVSDAILKYSYHLRYGLVNPKAVFKDNFYMPYDDSSKGDLFQPLTQKNIINYLLNIQPMSKRYKQLQVALKHYNRYKDSDWPAIPLPEKKIEAGNKNSSVAMIIDRLITLGFLDTSKVRINDSTFYDTLLVDCVKHFQRVNGLNDDGVIGKTTVERLNTTPQECINKIKLNLERFRWNNYPDTSQYVKVNIPDFRLFIVDNGDEIFNTKVCTGRKRPANYDNQLKYYKKTKRLRNKPDDWETPILYGEIYYLVLNPTWNVPPSIMREEIVQKMTKDSSYLRNHNFKVYADTGEVNPDDVNISELSAEKIPYRIIQDPGAGNALGKIKFMFNNPFGVYLHDTPTRIPFTYSNRAVSHGCVRVEKPLPLAEFLLKGHPKWNIDFLKIEIGMKIEDKSKISEYYKKRNSLRNNSRDNKTTEVFLSKKFPLYIDYFTAWVDSNGEINFREDVYSKDKILMEYLNSNKLI
jgi:L,D-transpeptidase YcbB